MTFKISDGHLHLDLHLINLHTSTEVSLLRAQVAISSLDNPVNVLFNGGSSTITINRAPEDGPYRDTTVLGILLLKTRPLIYIMEII